VATMQQEENRSSQRRAGGPSGHFGGALSLSAGGSGEDEREPWVQAFPPSHAPRRAALAMDLIDATATECYFGRRRC
jgi:hypothetical protein